MVHDYVTSFSSGEHRRSVTQFHNDLAQAVQGLLRPGGCALRTPVGSALLAGGATAGGTAQPDAANAAVMVSLCSGQYYADSGCGRDWSLFRERIRQAPSALYPDAEAAHVLIRWQPAGPPANGMPVPGMLDTAPDSEYTRRGLHGILSSPQGCRSAAYREVLAAAAAQVVRGLSAELPPLPAGLLGVLPPAFPLRPPTAPPSAAAPLTATAAGNGGAASGDDTRPRVFLSYAHEKHGDHDDLVEALYKFLLTQDINARIDLAVSHEPQDWPVWMMQELKQADIILIIASPAYKRRGELEEAQGVGLGAIYEASQVRSRIYEDPAGWYKSILRVVLPSDTAEDLPDWLGRKALTTYRVDPADPDSCRKLVAYIKSAVRRRPGGRATA